MISRRVVAAATNDDKYLVQLCSEEVREVVEAAVSRHATVRKHVRNLRRLPSMYVSARDSSRLRRIDGVCDVIRVRQHAAHLLDEHAARPMGAWWHADRLNQDLLPLDGDDSRRGNGSGVNIFVLDTGLDTTHPEFLGDDSREVRNVASFVDGDEWQWWPEVGWTTSPPQNWTALLNNDLHGHGTMTSATAAGGTLGTAPKANVYHARVLNENGWGDNEWSILALDALAELLSIIEEPSVVSLSFGDECDRGDVAYCRRNNPQALAIESIVDDFGVAVVVSAGNDADDGCFYLPQAATKAISVGASAVDDKVAPFSNYGSCVDLVAPGVLVPVARASLLPPDDDGIYALADGTSFAAPAVAGALAHYSQLLGRAPTAEIFDLLANAATRGVLTQAQPLAETTCPKNDRLLRTPASYETPPRFADFDFHRLDMADLCPLPLDRPTWPPLNLVEDSHKPRLLGAKVLALSALFLGIFFAALGGRRRRH
ncbi:hypothetical protein CTAYLR_007344 [Chrysophaeum taylorii]|uniref:subtilisin n=1 Tax=Chrysophaeum taylorii TaxID=2483200 RepID=A0AAD7UHU9_9STRA|nr:hypothetical protein CTAYLR_007344 [Chrysophaeum taylorii]